MEDPGGDDGIRLQHEANPEVGDEHSSDVIDAEAQAVKVKSLSINDTVDVTGGETKTENSTSQIRVEETKLRCLNQTPTSSQNVNLRNTNSSVQRYIDQHNIDLIDDETSGDDVNSSTETTNKEKMRPRSSSSEGKRSVIQDEDFPARKYRRHHNVNVDASNSNPTVQNNKSISEVQSMHTLESTEVIESSLSIDNVASDVHDMEEATVGNEELDDDDEDDDGINGDDERLEMELTLSDSSSDSIIFDHDVSSTSSDTSLEDLEEHRENLWIDNAESSTGTPKKTEGTKKNTSPELPQALCKPKPKETWIAPKELLRREIGRRPRTDAQHCHPGEFYRAGFYGSLFSAERLELMSKLNGHQGCVNCLNFNYSGTKLASGSDDLDIRIWNYSSGKCLTTFKPGHKANVFQVKFMPFVGIDTMIVSSGRDNQVRLTELASSGEVRSSRKLAQHVGPSHKLSISADTPHVILSCGEDASVLSIDIREEKPNRLLYVRERKRVPLYSIHHNPFFPQEFCVAGKDSYVRVYDSRKLPYSSIRSEESSSMSSGSSSLANGSIANYQRYPPPVKKFCPHHLESSGNIQSNTKTNVTAAVYNYNGTEILASYNDEHIYLFDSSHSDGADFIKKYEGHRNNATVKGVNFFGQRSQFVVSGSDCGHIFVWDKNTECIVNFFRGDENGVVNCLEGHPLFPLLATSGLDYDIKIWVPSHESPPKMPDLVSTVKRNYKKRESESRQNADSDGFVMWALLNQMRSRRGTERNRCLKKRCRVRHGTKRK